MEDWYGTEESFDAVKLMRSYKKKYHHWKDVST